MNPWLEKVRIKLRKRHFDIVRYYSLAEILNDLKIALVLDVGANVGQFATELRTFGYGGRIVSFEPVSLAFRDLEGRSKTDPAWEVMNIGLGENDERRTMQIDRGSRFNSILSKRPELAIISNVNQDMTEETIQIRRLDSIFDQVCPSKTDCFLKIDTQGYERQVLQGGNKSLAHIKGLQLELSLTPLYQDQPTIDEMLSYLREHGFVLWSMQRGFADMGTGQIYEVDGIFLRA